MVASTTTVTPSLSGPDPFKLVVVALPIMGENTMLNHVREEYLLRADREPVESDGASNYRHHFLSPIMPTLAVDNTTGPTTAADLVSALLSAAVMSNPGVRPVSALACIPEAVATLVDAGVMVESSALVSGAE